MNHTIREVVAAALLAVVVAVPSLVTLNAQTAGQNGFPDLIGALKATPGVLGVDAAGRTMNGKAVIFAWFENRKAALAWYNSDVHQRMLTQLAGGRRRSTPPLADVPEDTPILAIASLTMPGFTPGTPPPATPSVTQIAIELYAPLPGGIAAGGRFAPSTLKVPGMIERPIAPPPAAAQ
jgi:hypothetical protein